MKFFKNHCAICGTRLRSVDKGLMNCDGDPCCRSCWDEEEYKLNQLFEVKKFKISSRKKIVAKN